MAFRGYTAVPVVCSLVENRSCAHNRLIVVPGIWNYTAGSVFDGLTMVEWLERSSGCEIIGSAVRNIHPAYKQRVLMHGHQGWNVRHGLCHIYMRYVYIYIWVVYSLCFFCCLFITLTWWYVWCIEWASGNQEEVQACLVTLWLFIISCYSLYKTTLGLLCSWFENNPHFHKYSMDFHV